MRPRLTPAIADVRRAVRASLEALAAERAAPPRTEPPRRHADDRPAPLVLVALSGGPDSLALAAATAFEAPRAGCRAGAVVVDHGIQAGSASVAEAAAAQARGLGLDPVVVRRVRVDRRGRGVEDAARRARAAAIDDVRSECGAVAVLFGHTLEDQAETVLLGLARGSGPGSLRGMPEVAGANRRPLLDLRHETTRQACLDAGLEPWDDPMNDDPAYTRSRIRSRVLPLLERELGPGVAAALVRSAQLLREDDDALDGLAAEAAERIVRADGAHRILSVAALAAQPAAIRHRVIRLAALQATGAALTSERTRAISALVTDWRGQRAIEFPGGTVQRAGDRLVLRARGPAAD